MTAISVSERLLEMAAFYTPLALTVTFLCLLCRLEARICGARLNFRMVLI